MIMTTYSHLVVADTYDAMTQCGRRAAESEGPRHVTREVMSVSDLSRPVAAP
jgi:hypothetical protein